MTKCITKSGFEIEIDERVIRDKDFLDVCLEVRKATKDEDKWSLANKMYTIVLGKKGLKSLEDHVRKNNDGFCLVDVLATEFNEIIESTKNLKN